MRHPALLAVALAVAVVASLTAASPTVFLTAAHCAEDGERVGVTFDTDYEAGDKVHYGTFEADPAYDQVQSDPHDIAVVVLKTAVKGIAPAKLPRANSLSKLSSNKGETVRVQRWELELHRR